MAALVVITSHLPAPPERVWGLLQQPQVLCDVSAPLLQFTPRGAPWPAQWAAGEYHVGVRLFGLLPLDDQLIGIEFPPPLPPGQGHRLRDNGRACARDGGPGGLVKRWDHLMLVEPDGAGTRYTDRVAIDAGVLTPLVAAFARLLYRHRQKRWRALVAQASPASSARNSSSA